MRWVVVVAIAVVGCYREPDFSGTRFRCDAEHACPAGQTCVAGFCEGGDVDAANGGDGVACGGQICGAGQQCCADFVSGTPACIPVATSCNGFGATCDGIEDCGGGPCCVEGSTVACGAGCGAQACLEPEDCPANQPMCCFGLGTAEPWGRCLQSCP